MQQSSLASSSSSGGGGGWSSGGAGRPLRVVVVEDDDVFRHGLVQTLERTYGYKVVAQAVTGLEMVEAVQKNEPDVVVFDIHLPQLNGLDALRRLMQEKPVAAIAITIDRDLDLLKRGCQECVLGYLVKPFDFALVGPMIEVAHARFEQIRGLLAENERLQKSLESRKLIERAKGVLMRRHHWTEADAFRRLQRAAMNRRTTMADLARQILDGKEIEL